MLASLRLRLTSEHVSNEALYEWVREGKLPHLDQDTVGRTYLIKRSDLEAFLDANMTAVRS